MIRAAIFDFDGTIVDSMSVWNNSGKIYLEKLGIKAEDSLGDELLEMSMKEGAEYLKRVYGLEKSVTEICAGINRVIMDAYRFTIPLKEGVMTVLERFRNAGIKMVICTNTDREAFMPAVERLGIGYFFERIFTTSEMRISKNHQEAFLAVAEYLGAAPEETAVFEDALYAIRTAFEAGFITCGIYDETSRKNTERIKKFSTYYGYDYKELSGKIENMLSE
ncbi:MAG: HAD family phosphatase [Treponema sp.]|nr:HAD family phosphatase [Treponema sp.]